MKVKEKADSFALYYACMLTPPPEGMQAFGSHPLVKPVRAF